MNSLSLIFLFISLVRAGCRNCPVVDMEPMRHVDPIEPVQLVYIQPEVEVEATLQCLCCYEEKPLISHCKNNHQFCEECTENFLANKVDEGNADLCCPEQECDEVFRDKDIKKYLGAESYLEYETLAQEKCINDAIANGDLDGFEKCPHVSHSLSPSVSVWSRL
jgi:hypothetical protein